MPIGRASTLVLAAGLIAAAGVPDAHAEGAPQLGRPLRPFPGRGHVGHVGPSAPRPVPGPAGPRGPQGPAGPPGPGGEGGAARAALGASVSGILVNRSYATVVQDGGNAFARLRLFPGAASVGAFYGNGTGNKAFLGLGGLDGVRLADLESIRFQSRVPAESPVNRNVYVNLVVDLRCDASDPTYAVIVADDPVAAVGPRGQWNAYAVDAAEPAFKSVGGVGGLPSHLESAGAPLSQLTSAWPDACLVTADPFDNGMPRHTRLTPILLVLGDSATTQPLRIDLDDVRVDVAGEARLFGFGD